MRMPLVLAVMGILLLPLVHAQWFYDSEEIDVSLSLEGGATVREESSRARVDHVQVNLSLFPRTDASQELTSLDVRPDPLQVGEDVIFRFGENQEVSFFVDADIRKTNRLYPVTDKIAFPLDDIPEEMKRFTEPSKIIDSESDSVVRVASELAAGRDDLYEVVFEIAKWTKGNIQYNLSTLTADANQKASWVLYERQGVCDELTSLFIAMLRSLDIPARFVTGYAYTNSPLFAEDWGAHGWAEVYFPGAGWVPFDVTYGQYGWVDPTHIAMKKSVDPGDAATGYEWVGRDINLNLHPLESEVVVNDYSGSAPKLLSVDLEMVHDSVGFGSYNAVKATITNPQSFYVATAAYLSAPADLDFLSEYEQNILLGPGEEEVVFWVFEMPQDLERGFRYTYPMSVQTSRNQTAKASFVSSSREPVFSLSEIDAIVDQQRDEEEREYSSAVSLSCDAPKSVRAGENATFNCVIGNTGNSYLRNLQVCFNDVCQSLELGITQERTVELSLGGLKPGRHERQVRVENAVVSRAAMVNVEVLDEPTVEVSIESPGSVSFDERFNVSFALNRTSYALPQDVVVTMRVNRQDWEWTMDRLYESQRFEVPLEGKQLALGENGILVSVASKDEDGAVYRDIGSGEIALEGASLTERVYLGTMNTIRAASQADPLVTGVIGVVVLLVFFMIVFAVFKK